MPAVVVDTDVVSFQFKSDTRAKLYRPYLIGQTAFVSFMTIAELDEWTELSGWGTPKLERLHHFLGKFAVLYADRAVCRRWAEARSQARRNGLPIEAADGWIAATALHLNAPLVTHNPGDYAGIEGLTLLSAAKA